MDVTKYMQSENITVQLLKENPQRIIKILTEAKAVQTDYGIKLACEVDYNGNKKTWRLNRDTIKNLCEAYGTDSNLWIDKDIRLMLVSKGGKEFIIGYPEVIKTEGVKE